MNFKTLKVPATQIALYQLSICEPEPPYAAVQTITLPISPSRIRKSFVGMGAAYDTAGTPAQSGVNRQVDRYGMAPFTYEIEGTTGWDLHMTDGFASTGMAAIQNLEQMLFYYDQLNAEQRMTNSPYSYTMEWADFFNGEFYQVEPLGPLEINQSDRAPLLQYYRLRLVGIQPVSAPLIEDLLYDATAILMSAASSTVAQATLALSTSIVSTYS